MTDKPQYKNLRDEFAMAALIGIYANPKYSEVDQEMCIKWAFSTANSCMEERKK